MESGNKQATAGKRVPPVATRFKPGRSGNPAGRKAVPKEVRDARRRVVTDLVGELKLAADLAVDALLTIAASPSSKDADRIAAAREILDRSFGRPKAVIDADVRLNSVRTVSPDEIAAAAAHLIGSAT